MESFNPQVMLEVDPTYVTEESCRKNSPEAVVLKALGCFLLGATEDTDEIDVPLPGIPAPDLTENDTFEIAYSRCVTERYLIGPDRTVIFDQFHSKEDEFGYLFVQADQGYISMQIEDDGVAQAQYIFWLGNLRNGSATDCRVYCGWEVSHDNLVTDSTHLRKLDSFLDKLSKIIVYAEVAEIADLPELELDEEYSDQE